MDEIISNLDKIVDELVKKSQDIGNKSWLTSKKWKILDIINRLKACTRDIKNMQ